MMTYQILRGKRFWLLLVLPVVILWGSYQLYQSKSFGFSPARICSNFSYNPDWAIEEPQNNSQLKSILNQKFKYLAVGSQSYAFVSEDEKYVVKFFIMKHQIPRLSDLWNPEQVEVRKQNLLSIFNAHKLAYDELKTDTGLIYIHLNKSHDLQTRLQIVDRVGRTFFIDLDQTEFVIQEKAELIFTRLKKLLNQGDKEKMQQCIQSTLALVKRRIAKRITDHDKAVKHNYGFVGDRPIQLDIGRIEKTTPNPNHYKRITQRIDKWLKENDSSS